MVLKKSDPKALAEAVRLLSLQKPIIAPCDTIYGILGVYPRTEKRIRQIKGREEGKPFLVLAENESAVRRLCSVRLDPKLTAYWPGPLTIILPSASGGTLGIRVPDDSFLQDLLRRLKTPLYSTSVNRSGEPPLDSIEEIITEFSRDLDLIIDAGDLPEGKASTIIDATGLPYKILRQGALQVTL